MAIWWNWQWSDEDDRAEDYKKGSKPQKNNVKEIFLILCLSIVQSKYAIKYVSLLHRFVVLVVFLCK